MHVRFAACASALFLLLGCEAARVVDCGRSGRFARTEESVWCVYESRTAECPMLLPVEHRLGWGGLGCAAEENDPVPSHPCLDTGACELAGDGG